MKRFYNNCKSAANAVAKIEFESNGFEWVVYFGEFEDAAHYFFEGNLDFRYWWYEREVNWETGAIGRDWVLIEAGNGDNLREWKKMIS